MSTLLSAVWRFVLVNIHGNNNNANKIVEQVNLFNYLGNTSYEGELDIGNKLNNYLKITGILNNVFRLQKTLKKTRIKLYNTLALPVLLYGSEA